MSLQLDKHVLQRMPPHLRRDAGLPCLLSPLRELPSLLLEVHEHRQLYEPRGDGRREHRRGVPMQLPKALARGQLLTVPPAGERVEGLRRVH